MLLAREVLPPPMDATNQSVLVFGSFTEDEAKLFQTKSHEDSKGPEERAGLHFGSLNFASTHDASITSSCKKLKGIRRSKLTAKDRVRASGSSFKTDNLPDDIRCQANGDSSRCSSGAGVTENGNVSSNLISVQISEQKFKSTAILANLKVLAGLQESDNQNFFVDSVKSVTPMVEILNTMSENEDVVKSLLPRGLINPGNLCFLNATLQGLLSCSAFVQLLQDLRNRNIPKIGFRSLRAFVDFISQFDMPADSSPKNDVKGVIEIGKPFSPIMFDVVLKSFTPDLPYGISGRPRQEDAQEFLSFVMDQMHDELLKLDGYLSDSNGVKSPLLSSVEDDGWETVGPKNKSAVTRTQSFVPSQLTAIFGGQLRSLVKARGNKASATVQPFLLLHLDIFPEAVHTIEDALHLFSAPEILEGYKASTGKAGVVTASKAVKIQSPPKIMILNLMRFSYGSKGSSKLNKPVRFPLELVLGRELFVSPSSEGRKYQLVATITHHGREPSNGHYTTDARHPSGVWLHYNDASVMAVPTNKVLHDQAYLLFYKQM